MCIATPEKLLSVIESAAGPIGTIEHAGRRISVGLSLVPDAKAGDTVLCFRGNAIRRVDEQEADKIRSALSALADVMDGNVSEKTIEAGFADLIEHPGQLPQHLRAQMEKKNADR